MVVRHINAVLASWTLSSNGDETCKKNSAERSLVKNEHSEEW
jgi:hypothetical protein